MQLELDDVKRIERVEAENAAAIAQSLRATDRTSNASAWPLGGGHLVVTGAGFYVNRAIGVGLSATVSDDDFDFVEDRCRAADISAEIEACPWADPSLLAIAGRRGYRASWFRTVLVQHLQATPVSALSTDLDIRPVETNEDLDAWHQVTVAGFKLSAPRQQEISRRWGEALRHIAGNRLLVARLGDVPVAVSSLAVHGDVALLGGMTTHPEARNQGIQQALITFRLNRASSMGCTIAASTADPATVSERNLQRCGFQIAGTKVGLTQR